MKTKKLVCYNCGGHGFITTTYENGQTSAICPVCGGIGTHEIQMTNADRIRAMTDEELLGFLMQVQDATINRFAKFELPNYNALADWLQQPAEEDDHDERKENEHV